MQTVCGSIIVYGESAGIGKSRVITQDTPLTPANFYGDSKVEAEEALQKLTDNSFKVAILRPPMIYGKGSKGNYPLLAKLARKLPFFPNVKNQRSMLYVGNLCKLIAEVILREKDGIFYPQNKEYVSPVESAYSLPYSQYPGDSTPIPDYQTHLSLKVTIATTYQYPRHVSFLCQTNQFP